MPLSLPFVYVMYQYQCRLYAFNGNPNKMHIENNREIKFALIVHRESIYSFDNIISMKKAQNCCCEFCLYAMRFFLHEKNAIMLVDKNY